MEPELTHAEIEELLGAYALDALDDDERDAVEGHLPGCPRCRAEVADHREVAAMISHVGAPAPPGVWDRIVAELDDAPPPLRLAPVTTIGEGERQSRRRTWFTPLAAAAAVVAIVVASVALGRTIGSGDSTGNELVVEPTTFKLASTDGTVVVEAALLPDGRGYIEADALPALSRFQTYQLWAVMDDATISVGILGPDPHRTDFTVAGKPNALAITAEKAGGVVSSEHQPIVVGRPVSS
jgi:hypothetical protein